jgi:hypothetical protein
MLQLTPYISLISQQISIHCLWYNFGIALSHISYYNLLAQSGVDFETQSKLVTLMFETIKLKIILVVTSRSLFTHSFDDPLEGD